MVTKRDEMEPVTDLVIIGGGPAGLYAAFYAGLRDIRVTVLEAQEELGGKLNFYPEKFVWDVGALPPTKGHIIRQNLIEQATTFDATLYTDAKVTRIKQEDNQFYVEDKKGRVHPCHAVLFAIGGGIVSPKKLKIPVHDDVKRNIHYSFPNQEMIRRKNVLVSGGGDAAVDYANECLKFAEKVTIIYRGSALKAHEASAKLFQRNGGMLIFESEIQEIQKGETCAMSLVLNNKRKVEVDHLIVQHGHDRDSTFLESLDFPFKKEEEFYLFCEEPTKTNIEGIFAAGDIQFSKGKLYLLAGVFQEAANSINQIKQYLEPESNSYGMVSSHNHKFDKKNEELIKGKDY
ncbi:NAD(P)/FAD-dependent oxidoreductase [Enterococcus phoeniculicola]|uniref:Ferredoxin--NADP reductase n=1 Tax=Enterococcus phoeniculicola ATCC BAA-412 TaxID=1158610 RepID=R3TNC4_9ENTE|nr:NAD(P)/FAD-dependent oxidoreductase [Enterococcus phoeniculicola]EOL42538.1 hypothetical protein UC3_02890 [Enterococcus phoeniculicola ATCC BAA-412]EOT79183.1 hypothetical protein I589_00691 [Enterococcus phoeniculicola ATCC BAA-412]